MEDSYFDGSLIELVGWRVLGALLTIFTVGICYPWAVTMVYGWEIRHTVIEGKRLDFDGSATSLFLHWLLWWFLTMVTFGIYGFWVHIALKKWKTKHTYFMEFYD